MFRRACVNGILHYLCFSHFVFCPYFQFGRSILFAVCYTGDIDLFDMFVNKFDVPPNEHIELVSAAHYIIYYCYYYYEKNNRHVQLYLNTR